MTVAEAILSATAQLTQAAIDTPGYDARLLLMWTLKVRREDLAREPERALIEREQVIFAKAISLRMLRRPLPYITGEAWFYGRAFKINRAVLIPRPETELLVELALDACHSVPAPTLADIGTGSGCLAVTLACERPDAVVWATDLSPDALTLARKNVVRYALADRLTLLHGDLLAPLPSALKYDVIVSNPPYVTEAELPGLQPEVRDYEPVLALSGQLGASGADGTDLHRRLLHDAPAYLKSGGGLLLEVGQGQSENVAEAARESGYNNVTVHPDLSGIGRVVVGTWLG